MRDRTITIGYGFTALAVIAFIYYIVSGLSGRDISRLEGGVIFTVIYISFGIQALLNYLAGNKVWLPFGNTLIDAPAGETEDSNRWPIAVVAFVYIFLGFVALLAFLSVKLTR
ncbi:hypothetical protein [Haliea sp.]